MRSFTRLSFNIRLSILLALVVSLIPPTRTARAASFTVNSLLDVIANDGVCTLREAILAANNAPANANCGAGSPAADTITFSVSGTITLGSTLPNIVSGQGALTIDGGGNITISGNNSVRVMWVNSGANHTMQNLTVANGNAGVGGDGGGVYNNGGTLTITNSTFSQNSADFGGGVFNEDGTLTITNSIVSNNTADGSGGGIYNPSGTLIITDSTISGNSANDSSGGGIVNDSGTVTITNSVFSNNFALVGGGIFNGSGLVTITNSTFSGNSVTFDGGGIVNAAGTLTITNSTFSGNSAGNNQGGGIFNSGTLNFANTIIANSSGGDCFNPGIIGTNVNNLVENGSCSPALSGDPQLGPLADNGGPTQTFALLPGSPAIDAGANSVCPATDQRGVARPADGDGNNSFLCDIGAFEVAQSSPPVVTNVSAPGVGSLLEGMQITSAVTQLVVQFNHPLSPASAEDENNYLLLRAGGNGIQTQDCAGGVSGGDVSIAIDSAVYDNLYTVTLNVNGGTALPAGTYRLLVCGTTSVLSLVGVELNGGWIDYDLLFLVSSQTSGGGGSGGTSGSALQLPSTGFPFGRVTLLPHQPQEKAYSATDLMLEIPTLKVKAPIVGVLKSEGGWDVTWLGNSVGWLEGSAFPTWKGNTVLTGHVWNADNTAGPFRFLNTLWWGDRIYVHAYGQTYIYEVRSVEQVKPNDVAKMMKHEELSWLTLVTCREYDPKSGTYRYRVLVRAVLVEVK